MHYQDQTTNADHPDMVRSAPVPVQPAGQDAETDRDGDANGDDEQGYDPDRRTDDEPATDEAVEDLETSDDRAAAEVARDHGDSFQADPEHDTRDDAAADMNGGEVAEPAPQPTAFGAATVGGATAAAAMAGHDRGEQRDVRDEDTAQPGDGSLEERPGDIGAPGEAEDLDGGSRFDERAAEASSLNGGAAVSGDVPETVDQTASARPIDEPAEATDLVPADAADPVTAFFAAEMAQGFRDRWREVQLRFVDHPRAAAGEAQELVEEAMEALAAALAEQKSNLAGWNSDNANDTEQLRVVVRRYRDFLDRILGL